MCKSKMYLKYTFCKLWSKKHLPFIYRITKINLITLLISSGKGNGLQCIRDNLRRFENGTIVFQPEFYLILEFEQILNDYLI